MFYIKNFNINYPITDFFIEIYKFNILFLIFLFLFFIFIFSFVLIFLLNYFFIKNNKYFLLKNFFLEFFFIFIPFYFIIFLFFYSLFLLINFNFNSFLNIKIISYQWKWYFLYLYKYKKNLSFFSIISDCVFKVFNINKKKYNYDKQNVDFKLILPFNKLIRFIIFSNDVIHSLYIPSLGIKKDSIPSFLKDFYLKSNRLGIYKGFCTELCGKNHSYMPIIIKFLNIYCFNKWSICFSFKKFLNLNY
ncbi:Cytochrome c oxidase polypeptide II [Candidatus Nasuia deltocephalinicola]|uniref:cytochrome-c oxidase n=1 Tax=Candidatus Nasuia deltocephalincola TaxID=1160784 RepID=A0A7G6UHM8_9PROT|nr:Cytochrome c oxidase polypeptide II [Candidatus Nasuia deltocephalinicola]